MTNICFIVTIKQNYIKLKFNNRIVDNVNVDPSFIKK